MPVPPIDVPGDLVSDRNVHYFQAVARLRPSVTAAMARTDLAGLAAKVALRFPESNGGRGIVLPNHCTRNRGDVRLALLLLLAAVGVVLVIACANIASLLLARATGRRARNGNPRRSGSWPQPARASADHRKPAARGSRGRRRTAARLLGNRAAPGGDAGRYPASGSDPAGRASVASATILVAFASALLFGLVPALHAARADASLALREADRTTTGGRQRARTRAALVLAEIALTSILLVSAGLLLNSLVRLQHVDPGFHPEQVTLISMPLPQSRYPNGKRQAAFYGRMLEAMQRRREIQSAAILFPSPMEGRNAQGTGQFTIDGQPSMKRADRPFTAIASMSGDYFRTLGIPLIKGRTFTEKDGDAGPPVAIVNATLARRVLPGVDPLRGVFVSARTRTTIGSRSSE